MQTSDKHFPSSRNLLSVWTYKKVMFSSDKSAFCIQKFKIHRHCILFLNPKPVDKCFFINRLINNWLVTFPEITKSEEYKVFSIVPLSFLTALRNNLSLIFLLGRLYVFYLFANISWKSAIIKLNFVLILYLRFCSIELLSSQLPISVQ